MKKSLVQLAFNLFWLISGTLPENGILGTRSATNVCVRHTIAYLIENEKIYISFIFILFDNKHIHSGPKKLMKLNSKSISRKNLFDQIPFFAISKMAKNQFLNWGKSLKLPKMQFHEKKIGFI